LKDFFAMGGYAAFLWPAYAVTFVVVAWNIVAARRAHQEALLEARRRLSTDADGDAS
jgi:heme exporter protein D